MKLLLAHNYYRSSAPSGEDAVFEMEKALLVQAGHQIVTYERRNDEIGDSPIKRLSTAAAATWSARSYREIRLLIAKHRPDIAHFHNTFPLISPSAYAACRDFQVPVVQTLHNYRLICPNGLLMRAGSPCELCIGSLPMPALRYGCYRQSTSATAVVASMLIFNRGAGSYVRNVDKYIALTEFARQRFVRGGLPPTRVAVRPNFLSEEPSAGSGQGGYALYVGRLTPEKGVATLVDAWREIEFPLKIVGDGYLRGELELRARSANARVSFLGFRPRAEVLRLMQDAAFVVIPSQCYEGFPITALEAFATGSPLIVSALGALDEIVEAPVHGLKYPAGDSAALRAAALELIHTPAHLAAMRTANRLLFQRRYSPRHALLSLESIYDDVIVERRNRASLVA